MSDAGQPEQRPPLGIKLRSLFFAFGAVICLITILALLSPGGALDPIWRLNPDAQAAFQKIGKLSILLIVVVGSACALAAIGLATRAGWGASTHSRHSHDLLNALVRHELRTLIGLPIGGAMIAYLLIVRR